MTPWWIGLSGAQATVSCGEHQHRLHWHQGRLEALDHGDLEEERALAALGGEPFACIELLDAWDRHKDDLRALVLGAREPGDLLRVDPDSLTQRRGAGGPRRGPVMPPGAQRSSVRANRAVAILSSGSTVIGGGGWTGYTAAGPGRGVGRVSKQARSETELIRLLTLGGGIPDRLLATVAATWSRRSQSSQSSRAVANKARPQLHAALQGRAFAALRSWLSEPTLAAELTMIGATEQRSLIRVEGTVRAELPFSWLLDVWAKGLATVYGRFCLGAETGDGRQWRLTTVAPNLDGTEEITVILPTD
jgi:hypothetical protein